MREEALSTLISHTSTPQGSRAGTSSSSDTVSNVSGTENFQNDSALWAEQKFLNISECTALSLSSSLSHLNMRGQEVSLDYDDDDNCFFDFQQ